MEPSVINGAYHVNTCIGFVCFCVQSVLLTHWRWIHIVIYFTHSSVSPPLPPVIKSKAKNPSSQLVRGCITYYYSLLASTVSPTKHVLHALVGESPDRLTQSWLVIFDCTVKRRNYKCTVLSLISTPLSVLHYHYSLLDYHCWQLHYHKSQLHYHYSLLNYHNLLLNYHYSLLHYHYSLLHYHYSLIDYHNILLNYHYSLFTT